MFNSFGSKKDKSLEKRLNEQQFSIVNNFLKMQCTHTKRKLSTPDK